MLFGNSEQVISPTMMPLSFAFGGVVKHDYRVIETRIDLLSAIGLTHSQWVINPVALAAGLRPDERSRRPWEYEFFGAAH